MRIGASADDRKGTRPSSRKPVLRPKQGGGTSMRDATHARRLAELRLRFVDGPVLILSNAAGWARHGYNDEKMAQWLEEAERERAQGAE